MRILIRALAESLQLQANSRAVASTDDTTSIVMGPLILSLTRFDEDSWRLTWMSKLTQVTTTLIKSERGKYEIQRAWKQKKHVGETLSEEYKTLKMALSYYLGNVDTLKLRDDIASDAKEQIVEWVRELEHVNYTIKPKSSRMQARIGYPVLVGENKEREGIVLKMLPPQKPGQRPLVELRLSSGPETGRVIKVTSDKVWIE